MANIAIVRLYLVFLGAGLLTSGCDLDIQKESSIVIQSKPVPLTDNRQGPAFAPAWSPDGSKIAYSAWRYEGSPITYVLDVFCLVDSSISTLVESTPPIIDRPAWYPDNDRIIFSRLNESPFHYKFWVVSLSRKELLPFPEAPDMILNSGNPDMSPDGRRLLFDAGSFIYLSRTDDGKTFRLTSRNNGQLVSPAWAPDGERFACAGDGRIKIFELDSTKAVEITEFRGRNYFNAVDWSIQHPQFGSHIAASAFGVSVDIYSMPDFELIRQLNGWDASWSPDGTRIAYINRNEIYVADIFLEF